VILGLIGCRPDTLDPDEASALEAEVRATFPGSYDSLRDLALIGDFVIGAPHEARGEAHRTLTLRFLANDVPMAFLFAMAGKEVWEGIVLKDHEPRGRNGPCPAARRRRGWSHRVQAAAPARLATPRFSWLTPSIAAPSCGPRRAVSSVGRATDF
jgi:hypothetical protein